LVGTARFELATPCTPCKCATRLRHVPTLETVCYVVCRCATTGQRQIPVAPGVSFIANRDEVARRAATRREIVHDFGASRRCAEVPWQAPTPSLAERGAKALIRAMRILCTPREGLGREAFPWRARPAWICHMSSTVAAGSTIRPVSRTWPISGLSMSWRCRINVCRLTGIPRWLNDSAARSH
jgi:hypothetical protein